MFEVVPPGMHAMRIRPKVQPGDKPSAMAKAKPRKGMIKYWLSKPTSTPLGFLKAIRKSRHVSEAPMPSMMIIIIAPKSLVSNSVTMFNSVWFRRRLAP